MRPLLGSDRQPCQIGEGSPIQLCSRVPTSGRIHHFALAGPLIAGLIEDGVALGELAVDLHDLVVELN